MIAIGIDVGHRNTRACVVRDGEVRGRAVVPTDYDSETASRSAAEGAWRDAGLPDDARADAVVATGFGRTGVSIATSTVTEYTAAALAARHECATATSVVDIGAEGIRITRLAQDGSVAEFGTNDKCASGAGTFLANMARVMNVSVEELSSLASAHTQEISMDAQCAVFAESGLISLIHRQVPLEDIAWAVQEALVSKIEGVALRIGVSGELVLMGASCANTSLVGSIGERLGAHAMVASEPEYALAVGAACAAKQEVAA